MLKTEFTSMMRKNLKSTVKLDCELAALMHDEGHESDKDMPTVFDVCHVLNTLGLAKLSQSKTKGENGIEKLVTIFSARKKLQKLIDDCL